MALPEIKVNATVGGGIIGHRPVFNKSRYHAKVAAIPLY
jgi:hypothetical protein